MGLCQVTVLYYVVRLGSSRKLTATFLICDLTSTLLVNVDLIYIVIILTPECYVQVIWCNFVVQ